MTTPPTFTVGQVLTAAQMNAVGMWRITTCTASSVGGTAATASNGVITVGTGNSSVTIQNAFSADFDNYLVTINGMLSTTAGAALYLRCVTSAGVGNTANWKGNAAFVVSGAGGAFNNGFDNNTLSTACASIDDNPSSAHFNINGPFLAQRTGLSFNSTDSNYFRMGSSILDTAVSYTGFELAMNVGNMSGGKIRVYGMTN